jgi:hypothetical protein
VAACGTNSQDFATYSSAIHLTLHFSISPSTARLVWSLAKFDDSYLFDALSKNSSLSHYHDPLSAIFEFMKVPFLLSLSSLNNQFPFLLFLSFFLSPLNFSSFFFSFPSWLALERMIVCSNTAPIGATQTLGAQCVTLVC